MLKVRAGLAALLFASTLVANASAEEGGLALNRFDPAERGSDWFFADSLDLRGEHRFGLGATLDWAHDPLVIYDQDGDDDGQALVADQVFVHLGAVYQIVDRVRFGINLPIALYQRGDRAVVGRQTFGSSDATTLGDLRLGIDLRLLGVYRSPFSLALGVQVHIPTGDEEAFTSDGEPRIVPRLLAAGEVGPFVYAARIGVLVRPSGISYADNPWGTELVGAAAAGLRVHEQLVVGPELSTSTVISEADAVFSKTTTPVELMFGGHYRAGDFKFGAGFGPGLTRGVGSPEYRVLGGIEWFPEIADEPPPPPPPPPVKAAPSPPQPPLDTDKDGITDAEDACPLEVGVRTDDKKTNGCPAPEDRDKDGILDKDDACPSEPGVASDDPRTNGCPAPKDTDGDGILDDDDACPANAGPKSTDPRLNGCPLAQVEADSIKILEPVKFAYNSDRLLAESDGVLGAVLAIITSNPEIGAIQVQGHTDSRGSDNFNLQLSKRRAAAVKKWLVAHGVDKARVTSEGYGKTRPLDTNETEEGRTNNRRVEFRITTSGAPVQ